MRPNTYMVRTVTFILLASALAVVAYRMGARDALDRVERWESQLGATRRSRVAALAGFARYDQLARCRPLRRRDWQIAVGYEHVCMVERAGRQSSLHIRASGLAHRAQTAWHPRTPSEALFERDSIRRDWTKQNGTRCSPLQAQAGAAVAELWTVGGMQGTIVLDTLAPRGPLLLVAAMREPASACASPDSSSA